jgi:hypothetical protein
MPDRAYEILATGGTHASVCKGLGISLETFYAWLGRGNEHDNAYLKKDFSDRVREGEVAGEAWVDDLIAKGASEKFAGNPNLLIYKANKGKKTSRYLAKLDKKSTWEQKLEMLSTLYTDGIIDIEMYERLLKCFKERVGVMEQAKYEEFEARLNKLEVQRGNSNTV